MKKIISLLLVFIMVLSLCACANDGEKSNDDGNKTDGGNKPAATEPTEAPDNRIALDVFAGVSVKCKPAINGFGESIEIQYDYTKVNYDKSNTGIKDFLEGIEFSTDNYKNLSNGDEIVLNASWSKSTADALNLKLKEEKKVYKVSGMYDVYRKASDVPSKLSEIDDIRTEIEDSYPDWVEDHSWFDSEPRRIDYHYYYVYTNDPAGNPYISSIYISAGITAEYRSDEDGKRYEEVVGFLGHCSLYQSYLEKDDEPYAWRNDDVSDDGKWNGKGNFVKVEEFFP